MKKISKQVAFLLMVFIGALFVSTQTARADYENSGTVYFHYAVGAGDWTYNQSMTKEGTNKYKFTVNNLNNATVHFGFSKGQASGNEMWKSVFEAGNNCYTCGDNNKGEQTPSQNQKLYLYGTCDHNMKLDNLTGDVTFTLDLSGNDYGVFTYTVGATAKFEQGKTYYINPKACTWYKDDGYGIGVKVGNEEIICEKVNAEGYTDLYKFICPANVAKITVQRSKVDATSYDGFEVSAPTNGGNLYTTSSDFKGGSWSKVDIEEINNNDDDKTLYIAYNTGHNDGEAWKAYDALTVSEDGMTYTFDIPVKNDHRIYWRFITNKSLVSQMTGAGNTMASNNPALFAPGNGQVNTLNVSSVEAGKGHDCWTVSPDYNGVYHVTAKFLNDEKTKISFSLVFERNAYVAKPDVFYCIGSVSTNSTWVKFPTRTVVEGEYTQWTANVTANNQEVNFMIGEDVYHIQGSNDSYHSKNLNGQKRSAFETLSKDKPGHYYIQGNRTYQFMVRLFEPMGDEDIDYEVAARKIEADAAFTEYGATQTNETYTFTKVPVDLENESADEAFNTTVTFDDATKSMGVVATGATTPTLVWVKYEHPFWGAQTVAQMEFDGELSVAQALYNSDTYLRPDDPRVKYWFTGNLLANFLDGKRTWAIDKADGQDSFQCREANGNSYYRAYVIVPEAQLQRARSRRAVIDTSSSSNLTRVAMTAPMPAEAVDPGVLSGVENVAIDGVEGEAEYYTISGVRVYGEPAPGLYIVRRGNQVTKEYVK